MLKEGVEKSAVVAVGGMKGCVTNEIESDVAPWLENKGGGLGLGEIDELNIWLVCLKCLNDI